MPFTFVRQTRPSCLLNQFLLIFLGNRLCQTVVWSADKREDDEQDVDHCIMKGKERAPTTRWKPF